ncbi:MAG: 2Fe-2S iron-sulfur cluster-binding protein [Pyrinomonadaceae bacterium]
MSVEVTFLPAGLTGLVAEGTYVLDAARRMGVPLVAKCPGTGDCKTCRVLIIAGDSLLSAPTETEIRIVGLQQLMANQRLACQTRAEKSGELVVEIMTYKKPAENDPVSDFRKEFARLPLNRKLATLVQLEVATMVEAFDTIANRSTSVGEKLLDKLGSLGKTKAKRSQSPKKK